MTIEENAKKLSALARDASALRGDIHESASVIKQALAEGGKVLACGNGGSASDADHFVAELVCKYRKNRKPLAGISLNSNTSVMTAISNDFGFEHVFERQVEALGKPGDVLIVISTSGASKNVVLAAKKGKALGLRTIALTGNAGTLARECEIAIQVPSSEVPRIQEIHAFALHEICEALEE